MPLFTPNDADLIVAQFQRQYHALGRALGYPAEPVDHDAEPEGQLHRDVLRLVGVANGIFDRTDANVQRAESALDRIMRLLHSGALHPPPADSHTSERVAGAPMPDAFWDTVLGVLVSRTRWWVSADDLLTISNAAALAFGDNTQANRMRITRAINRGELDAVPDPSVANPQHSKRVLKAQVERLGALRRPGAYRQ